MAQTEDAQNAGIRTDGVYALIYPGQPADADKAGLRYRVVRLYPDGSAVEADVTGDRAAYFWATHSGAELDLLLFHKGQRLGFEFKFSEQPATTKSMRIAQQDLSLDHLYIVHPGERDYPLDESITATPLAHLLHILHPGPGHA